MSTVKELRRRGALSQQDVATATGISLPTIKRLEKQGRRPHPRTIRALAEFFKVKPDAIAFPGNAS